MKIPTGPLTAIEMWKLGQALAGKDARKISGRLDLEMGAGSYYDSHGREQYGASIPSKGGKLLAGFRGAPKDAITIAAAPGNTANVLFTVYHRAGKSESSDAFTWGIRFAATPPVRWKLQKPIPTKEWNARAAVWTPGATTNDLDWYFAKMKTGSILEASSSRTKKKEPTHWALGFDAKGKAVCMLFAIPDPKLLRAIDGKVLAEPSADELAGLQSQPHRLALSPKQLTMIAGALRNGGSKLRDSGDKWKALSVVTKDVSLRLSGKAVAKVSSVKGVLCLGNLLAPAQAMKLELGDDHNRSFGLTIDTGRCHVEKVDLRGATLSDEAPVCWKVMGKFAPGKPWPKESEQRAFIGVWSPGQKFARDHDTGARDGAYSWSVRSDVPLIWVIGYDASDKPAAILVGDARAAAYFDGTGDALVYDEAAAARQIEVARADHERRAKAAAAEEAADDAAADGDAPVPPATADELAAIAAAIAAGPSKKKTTIAKRFSLSWDATEIPTVKGKLRVGDPNGASFDLTAGADGPKKAFLFFDDEDEDAGAWGRAIVGVRLGEGKAVKWKPSMGLGVDSGRYGVWSPGYPTSDVDPGTHTANALAAKILQTSEGDCSFPSLIGLNAAKQPVAFLFGEAVRLEVFAEH